MIIYNDEMYHAGIKGMRWGVRRYQNDDGSLTEAGKQRYGTRENFERERATQHANRIKTLKKAAIIGGSALALGGAAYLGATRTEVGRQAVAKGKDLVRQLLGRGLDNRVTRSKVGGDHSIENAFNRSSSLAAKTGNGFGKNNLMTRKPDLASIRKTLHDNAVRTREYAGQEIIPGVRLIKNMSGKK